MLTTAIRHSVWPAGPLWVAYHRRGGYDAAGEDVVDKSLVDTWVVHSRDGGRSWAGAAPLNYSQLNGASPFGKIRTGPDGVLYMPISPVHCWRTSGALLRPAPTTIRPIFCVPTTRVRLGESQS